MDQQHIYPTNDSIEHFTDEYSRMGCPCDPSESLEGGILHVFHNRMDGKLNEVDMAFVGKINRDK